MKYRLLHVAVPRGLADKAQGALEEGDLGARRVDGEDSSLFLAYATVDRVEAATEALRDVGIGERGFVSITSTEAVISAEADEAGEAEEAEESKRISTEELVSDARGMSELTTNFLVLTVISAMIATAGILADSTAIVIGS